MRSLLRLLPRKVQPSTRIINARRSMARRPCGLSPTRRSPHFHVPAVFDRGMQDPVNPKVRTHLTRRVAMRKMRWLLATLTAVALLPGYALSQERVNITGQIVEAGSQRPLQGALVSIERLRLNVQSDVNGRFSLNAPAGAHTLMISFIGYKTVNRDVTASAGMAPVQVVLETDPLRLDELVVTGYTQERRRFVTGAIASLKTESVKEIPAPQITEIMRGRTPGVQVT